MNLYEAIYVRKSVRKFQMAAVDSKIMNHIKKYISTVTPLDDSIAYHIEIIDAMQETVSFKGLWKVDAPYYLVFYCEEVEGAQLNAGYIMEQVVLYLTCKGLGTCYQGALKVKPSSEAIALGQKPYMVVAFGYGKENIERDASQAKRYRMQDIAIYKEEIGEEIKTMLRAAKIAPSSMNAQPWRFVAYHNRIHIFLRREGFKSPFQKRLGDVNIGIVIAHLALAAEELWLEATIKTVDSISEREFKNNQYITTIFVQ